MAAFFGNIKGYYVEVGANDPRERSQTWHLEQQGWTGVLIEPQPDLAATAARRKPVRSHSGTGRSGFRTGSILRRCQFLISS